MPPIFLLFCFVQAKRIYATHSVVAFTGSSGHLRFSKLPSDFRRLRGLLASMRFNGSRGCSERAKRVSMSQYVVGLAFLLSSLPYVKRSSIAPFMPPFLSKGRCHEVTEGIRKSVSEKTRDVKSLLLPSLCKRGAIGATLSRPFPVQKGKRAGAFFRKTFLKKFFQTLDLQYESVL